MVAPKTRELLLQEVQTLPDALSEEVFDFVRLARTRRTEDTIPIRIPREVAHVTRMTAQELGRELAIYLFQQGKLSFGKAREMAGMSVWDFQQLLGSRGGAVHYDVEEYEADLATLQEMGRI